MNAGNIILLLTISFSCSIICLPQIPENFSRYNHANNWAVLISTSRYWYNYRHVANVLSIYRCVKRLGIPDSQIILLISDDIACNPRNPKPAEVFNSNYNHINVYSDDVEVDYRGYEVTVENLVRLLTGRVLHGTPSSKQLLTDEGSNVLVYLTGHGGNNFIKFQDSEVLSGEELANAFEQMWQKQRYHELLFIVDTCEAESMYEKFYSPNILAVASSLTGQNSVSHDTDRSIGAFISTEYTNLILEFLEKVYIGSNKTMGELLSVTARQVWYSTVGIRKDLYHRDLYLVPVTDFFGSVRPVKITNSIINATAFAVASLENKIEVNDLTFSFIPQVPQI